MSTGMGGTNAHVVLEQAPEPAASTDRQSPSLADAVGRRRQTALDLATHRLREF